MFWFQGRCGHSQGDAADKRREPAALEVLGPELGLFPSSVGSQDDYQEMS